MKLFVESVRASLRRRHCEERSDEAIEKPTALDRFVRSEPR